MLERNQLDGERGDIHGEAWQDDNLEEYEVQLGKWKPGADRQHVKKSIMVSAQ